MLIQAMLTAKSQVERFTFSPLAAKYELLALIQQQTG